MRRWNSKGAILIEFAFGLPILVLMMYFCLDVPRAYQFVNKLTTCSEMAADLITNVYSYSGDNNISIEELKYVSRALEIYFLGNPARQQEYGFNISMYITCVTGIEGGKFKTNWIVGVDNDISNQKISVYRSSQKGSIPFEGFSETKSQAISSDLNNTEFKNFEIGKGDIKLVVEAFVWRKSEGRGFNRQFYMMSLPMKLVANKFVVITPPKGLISDEYPPMTEDELKDLQELLEKHQEEDSNKSVEIQTQRALEEIDNEDLLKTYMDEYRKIVERNVKQNQLSTYEKDKLIENMIQTERNKQQLLYKNLLDQKYNAQQKTLDAQHKSEIKNFTSSLPNNC